jgi:exodeoxyribonuclease VII large subunit
VDLFSKVQSEPKPLTVSQLNQQARLLLERSFARVTVVGEISGHKIVQGHHYFSLKDERAQVNAVLFAREAKGLRIPLRDGAQVIATGKLSIYPQYGRYQLVLDSIEPQGAGALAAAFEQLKARLAAEGLFDPAKKRRLPRLPRRVAVVTSPTGAVIRDILHVAARRFPRANILLVPSRVQGAESAPQLVRAISRISAMAPGLGVDVLVLARGGGSLEDLWCFNDEKVARAIASCPIPVVSAVGHETDFTIADFVADVRAPTPSAAAELCFPIYSELVAALSERRQRCQAGLRRLVEHKRLQLRAARGELYDARSLVRHERQRLAQLVATSQRALSGQITRRQKALQTLERRVAAHHPRSHLREVRGRLESARSRVELSLRQRLTSMRARLAACEARLGDLSPLQVLERGYAIVHGPDGRALRAATEVKRGDPLTVRLHEGRLLAQVKDVVGDD